MTSNIGILCSVPLKFDNIPWYETKHIKKAQSTLVKMTNSLSDNSEIKNYIIKNCSSSLNSLKGDTGF